MQPVGKTYLINVLATFFLSASVTFTTLYGMEGNEKMSPLLIFLKENGEKRYKRQQELAKKKELAKKQYKQKLLAKKHVEVAKQSQKKQIHDIVSNCLENIEKMHLCPICRDPLENGYSIAMHPGERRCAKQHSLHASCLWKWLKSSDGLEKYDIWDEVGKEIDELCVVCKGPGKIKNSDMHMGALEALKNQPLKETVDNELFFYDSLQQLGFSEKNRVFWRDVPKIMLIFERIDTMSSAELAKELDADCIKLIAQALDRLLSLYEGMFVDAWVKGAEISFVGQLREGLQELARIFFDRIDLQRIPLSIVVGMMRISNNKDLCTKVAESLLKVSEDKLAILLEKNGALALEDFAEDVDVCRRLSCFSSLLLDFDSRAKDHFTKIMSLCAFESEEGDLLMLVYLGVLSYTIVKEHWSQLPTKRQLALSIAACTILRSVSEVLNATDLVGATYKNLDAEEHKTYLELLAKALIAHYDNKDESFYRLCGELEQTFLFLGPETLEVDVEAAEYWRDLLLQNGLNEESLFESIVPDFGPALASIFNRGLFKENLLKDCLLKRRHLWPDELWKEFVEDTLPFIAENKREKFKGIFEV